jgi:hypothetical protein
MRFLYSEAARYPLQTLQEFNISSYEDNPMHKIGFIAGVLIIAGIFLYLNLSKKVKSSKIYATGRVGEGKVPEDGVFKRIGRMYELKKEEIAILKEIIGRGRDEPEDALKNTDTLDALFKAHYQRLAKEAERSKEAMQDISLLFSTRNAIAYFTETNVDAKKKSNAIPRKYRRKALNAPCVCSLVSLSRQKEKGKSVKKFTLTGENFPAAVIDLSQGGCAAKAKFSVKPGTHFKIEIKLGRGNLPMLGEVLRINRQGAEAIMHVRFVKALPKTLNAVNAYIFDYL